MRHNDDSAGGQLSLPACGTGDIPAAVSAPPTGFGFPSTVATATLQALSGAPFSIVSGSRGEAVHAEPGPALQIDVPLDPSSGSLQIVKTTIKAVIGVGEFLPYTLAIRNNSALAPVLNAHIVDRLPPGFRYQRGIGTTERRAGGRTDRVGATDAA